MSVSNILEGLFKFLKKDPIIQFEKLAKKEGAELSKELNYRGLGVTKYSYDTGNSVHTIYVDAKNKLFKSIDLTVTPQMEALGITKIKVTDHINKTATTTMSLDPKLVINNFEQEFAKHTIPNANARMDNLTRKPYDVEKDLGNRAYFATLEPVESYKKFEGAHINIIDNADGTRPVKNSLDTAHPNGWTLGTKDIKYTIPTYNYVTPLKR